MIIKILRKLDNDLYAQYEAINLSEEKIIETANVYRGHTSLNLSKGQTIKVNSECLAGAELHGEIFCEGIFSIYAKNKDKGALLSITRLL